MSRSLLLAACLCLIALTVSVQAASFSAGAAKINATLPLGAPLAGYNHGLRRVPHWPIPQFTRYTTFMTPSQGTMDPTYVKALVVDDGKTRICIVTMDLMCADSSLEDLAYAYARGDGFTVPLDNVVFSGSHSHSGPGGWVPQFGIQMTPTMDLFVPPLQRMLAHSIAEAMVQAEKTMQPAKVVVGSGYLVGVTHNRRAKISPYVGPNTIDPHLGVVRVDKMDGTPLATVWNYAVHGVCWGADNMLFSADIMGGVCDYVESKIGGIAMFQNADAGDISPGGNLVNTCGNKPNYDGAPVIGDAIIATRNNMTASAVGEIQAVSNTIYFGHTNTNWTLARNDNCTMGGPHDICTICNALGCEANLEGGEAWVEEQPRFTAFRFSINGVNSLMVSIPGEALLELGWQIRNDSLDLGYDNTLLMGYTNNYMMYFATPNEYVIGGYEAFLTLFGIDTTNMIRSGCYSVASQLAPKKPTLTPVKDYARPQSDRDRDAKGTNKKIPSRW